LNTSLLEVAVVVAEALTLDTVAVAAVLADSVLAPACQ
jgi:hypothetical protein